ncbi:FAD synthase [Methanosarcinales archaeon ex4572_44]|nr:MAG: FAD synthase [Methanosarcinales archaeon ex4484_138]PHP45190.1 MAG: FAD synthase [Methanosarcinales archaeon ex4572_44]RLG25264.1 MAG: FAD synthase [Methanosarcinales archaeon]RLG26002.1 MAG: FAD synthase [Methanosarcinales archaeon]
MVRVLATGTFDILHPGHVKYLSESKRLGDDLFVIVAREEMVHHKPKPFLPDEQRLAMVKALGMVDHAVLGDVENMFRPVREISPDIVTLGYNQHFDEEELSGQLEREGIHARVVRISDSKQCKLCSTRAIIRRIQGIYERE